MTHNEYTNKYKSEIFNLNQKVREYFRELRNDTTRNVKPPFLQRVKEEALRAEFMGQFQDRELSNKAVTEDGRVV